MKNTKQKILEKSLEIFNQRGYSSTSLRTISQELGMSQGNLNYHFRKKEDLIEALYFQLVEELNVAFEGMTNSASLLLDMYQSSGITMRLLYKYRFLMRDFYLIMSSFQNMSGHYQQLQNQRKLQFQQVFAHLMQLGVIRAEVFESEYERLYERMNILGDNWINAQELLKKEISDPVKHYQGLLFEIIFPYLTLKGREEYALIQKLF